MFLIHFVSMSSTCDYLAASVYIWDCSLRTEDTGVMSVFLRWPWELSAQCNLKRTRANKQNAGKSRKQLHQLDNTWATFIKNAAEWENNKCRNTLQIQKSQLEAKMWTICPHMAWERLLSHQKNIHWSQFPNTTNFNSFMSHKPWQQQACPRRFQVCLSIFSVTGNSSCSCLYYLQHFCVVACVGFVFSLSCQIDEAVFLISLRCGYSHVFSKVAVRWAPEATMFSSCVRVCVHTFPVHKDEISLNKVNEWSWVFFKNFYGQSWSICSGSTPEIASSNYACV